MARCSLRNTQKTILPISKPFNEDYTLPLSKWAVILLGGKIKYFISKIPLSGFMTYIYIKMYQITHLKYIVYCYKNFSSIKVLKKYYHQFLVYVNKLHNSIEQKGQHCNCTLIFCFFLKFTFWCILVALHFSHFPKSTVTEKHSN